MPSPPEAYTPQALIPRPITALEDPSGVGPLKFRDVASVDVGGHVVLIQTPVVAHDGFDEDLGQDNTPFSFFPFLLPPKGKRACNVLSAVT
jgi:hypothetical protein